jgi:hypothetical protein
VLGERSPAAAVRALQGEHGVAERQARRYVRAAQAAPGGVAVPERTAVFTVKLPASLIARLRAVALRSSSWATAWRRPGWRRRMRCWCPNGGG